MAIASAKWLGLGYLTYFFCYGIYLPFWGVWLKGTGLDAEKIGLLLGCGMVVRFAGSLLIASQVKHPVQLITALRLLALATGSGWRAWRDLLRENSVWRFMLWSRSCRAHMLLIMVLAPSGGSRAGTPPRWWGICGRLASWRKLSFLP